MNEEQNGTISDGLIVLQILNRSEPLSNIIKLNMSGGLIVSGISLPFRR